MWICIASEKELPAPGGVRSFPCSGRQVAVLRGKDGDLYAADDALPPLLQPLSGPGVQFDGRILRADCAALGTKFDLRNGEVMGAWCPGRGVRTLGEESLLFLLFLELVSFLARFFCRRSRLQTLRSRVVEGRFEVLAESPPKRWANPLRAAARWLTIPHRQSAALPADTAVDIQVVPLASRQGAEELKISAVLSSRRPWRRAEAGRAVLRLPPRRMQQPQMGALVRETFGRPDLKETEIFVAVWVAQFVAPMARGLGLDQRMFNKMLDVLHTRGYNFVLLLVDSRSARLAERLRDHYEAQGCVAVPEPNAMGLANAMLLSVCGNVVPKQPTKVATSLLATSALRLAHGYVSAPLLLEFVQVVLPALRSGTWQCGNEGPLRVLLRAMQVLGYVSTDADGKVSAVESQQLQALVTLLASGGACDTLLCNIYQQAWPPFALNSEKAAVCFEAWQTRPWRAEASAGLQLLDGAILTPLLTSLVVALRAEGSSLVGEKTISMEPRWTKTLDGLLNETLGVGSCNEKGVVQITAPGALALQRTYTFLVASSYAPMLANMQRILFKDAAWAFGESSPKAEVHVDRTLNVMGSGLQHKVFFRDFLELIRPLFATSDFAEQPRYVADTGCGDGSLLCQIYEFVKLHTPRGRALKEFPLTMIGIDLSASALAATASTLRARGVPHQLLEGDIGDPGGLCNELRRLNLDPRQTLHVRSFLDHDRPFREPAHPLRAGSSRDLFVAHHFDQAVYLDRSGKVIQPVDIYQSLVEHFGRWADASGEHGLCILEAMLLDVPSTAKYFDENVSFHFDIEAALSRQYLVPPVANCLALAEAGLFSCTSDASSHCYPESGEYCRIMSQHVKRSSFSVRLAEFDDLAGLVQLQQEAKVTSALEASPETLAARLLKAPLGVLVAERAGKLLGAAYTTRRLGPATSGIEAEPSQPSADHGDVLQLVALHALPEAPGVGSLLRDFLLQLAWVDPDVKSVVGLTRFDGWAASGLSQEDYIRRHLEGEVSDKVLAFHTQRGATIVKLVHDARPTDVANQGAAVLIRYEPGRPQRDHRVASRESQEATVDTVEAFIHEQLAKMNIQLKDADFAELGLDSLELAALRRSVERRFGFRGDAAAATARELAASCFRGGSNLQRTDARAVVESFLLDFGEADSQIVPTQSASLAEMGLDSLDIARLRERLQARLSVQLSVEELAAAANVDSIIEAVRAKMQTAAA
ncbi:blc [Symbiodinium sp. CCMP2592]|nr:blc [Symbiodinium sp. CCMP2592]